MPSPRPTLNAAGARATIERQAGALKDLLATTTDADQDRIAGAIVERGLGAGAAPGITLAKSAPGALFTGPLPEDALAFVSLNHLRLEAFEADLMEHMHLENNLLFPRIVPAA